MRRYAALVAAAVLCGGAWAQSANQFSPDYDPRITPGWVGEDKGDWQEAGLTLPGYPKADNLIAFDVSAINSFSFFIDAESISAGKDGTVRYTLVARSSSGNENVSYNGLRCSTGEHRLYANGRTADKSWVPVRDGKWKRVEVRTVTRQHLVLMRDFFCPAAIAITSRDEGVDALKRGYHPQAVSNSPLYIRP